MQGKVYANGYYEGVGFPTPKKRSTEWEEIGSQFAGAGYCTKRGVLNLQMHGTAPPPKVRQSEIESRLVGVVMAQQYK